ncbi:carbohydrate-binding module family 1 protein [Lentithecium fluviatile CBS 122367]|uniref:Carbohydrate-binding module family 1 protein n=1 Tax=Lentithecium fluviatile CBS 122367 TaxID=1168545 RepID=A0A6G1JHJ0_9PLEO|nr:carbohydrate-binding module family 1 protein [Lentithecium fluviatile CBS 122367]
MAQSSITAWLKKPATANKTNAPTLAPVSVPMPSRPEPRVDGPPAAPKPSLFSLPPLPSNVELLPLTEELMPGFKRLTALTLPIAYPPAFYTESLTEPYHGITLMALWRTAPTSTILSSSTEKPRLIGAIRCRILASANLYIATISLLAPYRSHGIATHLLQRVVAKASEEHGVKCVTAHVWEANEEGLEWYKKRGFEIIGKEDAYYRKLKPSGAVLKRQKDTTFTVTCLGPTCTDYPPTTLSIPSTIPGGQPVTTTTTTTSKTTTVKTTTTTPTKTTTTSKTTTSTPKITTTTSKTTTTTSKITTASTKKTTSTDYEPTKTGPSSTRCPVPLYFQCGGYYDGKPWTGCTKCVNGASCVQQNEWYDQCVADE